MFTGLIEAVCQVRSVRRTADTMQIAVDLTTLAQDTKIGDSIAINGTCLTVISLEGTVANFDVSSETLRKSNVGKLASLAKVNVERALKPADRFGGHFVQGHIDGTAKINNIKKQGDFAQFEFYADNQLLDQMILKGSVAVNGISLTISKLDQASFGVELIPQTLSNTTLGNAKVADVVNIEIDMISKTVKKQIEKILPQNQKLTVEKLRELGF